MAIEDIERRRELERQAIELHSLRDGVCKFCHQERGAIKDGLLECVSEQDLQKEYLGKASLYWEAVAKELKQAGFTK